MEREGWIFLAVVSVAALLAYYIFAALWYRRRIEWDKYAERRGMELDGTLPMTRLVLTFPSTHPQGFKVAARLGVGYEYDIESPWPEVVTKLVEGAWRPHLDELCRLTGVDGLSVAFDSQDFELGARGTGDNPEVLYPVVMEGIKLAKLLRRMLDAKEGGDGPEG